MAYTSSICGCAFYAHCIVRWWQPAATFRLAVHAAARLNIMQMPAPQQHKVAYHMTAYAGPLGRQHQTAARRPSTTLQTSLEVPWINADVLTVSHGGTLADTSHFAASKEYQ
eukprot:TRINITY_DN1060_c0_g1_i4.p2 TRINITY_DN1060_c0_g1~~TRINITY_DN1060_c0_g1_i4.p2  ORF type:complete len:112 (-),score=7.69 TRINITY_DN1060_c0_g1_i4:226-561(-)